MQFFKYEGLGNDFIIIPAKPCLSTAQVQNYCDRHRGIGADGILFVFEEAGLWGMKIFNADGSIPEMCGNGIRCVAQWLLDQGHRVTQIQTDAGVKTCQYESGFWSINMGLAQIHGNKVSMGNPHQVFIGPVQSNQIDPEINTEFVEIMSSHEISATVFERGVGETLACGTGACAAVALLVYEKHLKEDTEITVHLNGGSLYITPRQTPAGLEIQMKGPARYVFEGKIPQKFS